MIKRVIKNIVQYFFNARYTLYNSVDEYEQVKKETLERKNRLEWYIMMLLKVIMLCLIIILSLMLFGCANKVHYKDVYIPVKCNIGTIERPKTSGNILKDNLNILKYAEQLELSINKCK